jgi:subtilisin-like proprotein convertase family protein
VLFYPGVGQGDILFSRSTTQIPLNTWTHIAGTYDGTTTSIVINGALDTSTTVFQGPIATNADSLFIGAEWYSGHGVFIPNFKGYMDEVRIWSVARLPNQIAFDRFIPLAILNPNLDGPYAGLLNAWRMNGNALDEAGFASNDGTPYNMSFLDLRQKQVSYLDYNNSLLLDTFNAYCVAGPSPEFNATNSITLEAWIYDYFPADSSFQAIVVKGGETSWNYGLFSNPVAPKTGAGFRIIFAVNYGDTIGSPIVPQETWLHVAATYNSVTRTAVIYVNGDSVAGRVFATAGLIPNDPDSLYIGSFRPAQKRYQFSGQIDELRIWKNVIRTRDEIRTNLYNSISFSSVPWPGSNFTAYSFDGRNTNEMIQWRGTPAIDFVGGARTTSAHQQLGGEYSSPVLRDDYGQFGAGTYVMSRRQLKIEKNPSGIVDSVYVAAPGPSTNVRLALFVSYAPVQDLDITLTGPTGVSVKLFGPGEGGFDRDIMTIFTDGADSSGGNGSGGGFRGPFSPWLKPVTPLSAFVGKSRQGWWKLKVVDASTFMTGILCSWGVQTSPLTSVETTEGLPERFAILQNYPNPFNPTTTIKFTVPEEVEVNLSVFNMLGQLVTTLVNERKMPGSYSATFDASRYSSGTYFYRIMAGSFVQTRRMLLLK